MLVDETRAATTATGSSMRTSCTYRSAAPGYRRRPDRERIGPALIGGTALGGAPLEPWDCERCSVAGLAIS